MCVIEQRCTRSKMCANKNVHELKLKDIGVNNDISSIYNFTSVRMSNKI